MQQLSSTTSRLSVGTKIALAALCLLVSSIAVVSVSRLASPVSGNSSLFGSNAEYTQRYRLLSQQIQELVDQEEEANLQALSKARATLAKTFKIYSSRVPRFSEEIASFGTRLSIAAKSRHANSKKNKNEANAYIRKIFGQKVVSQRKMTQDIRQIIAQFHQDLAQNRQTFIDNAARRIHEAKLEDTRYKNHETRLRQKIAGHIHQEQKQQTARTYKIAHEGYKAKGIAKESSDTLNAQIIRMSTSNILIEVLLQASTAVGLVIGLGVGYLADEWLSMRLQKKITRKTRSTLARMHRDIWLHPESGMKVKMERAIQENKKISATAIDKVVLSSLS